MIEHVVLFKFKENVSEEAKEKMREGIRSMKEKILSIDALEEGVALDMKRTKGYDYCLVVRFKNKEDLDKYQVDPYHQEEIVAKIVKPLVSDVLAFDFEF